mmetsp:Transcript_15449/g.38468  ORF Transcript_15449/g.38468 Transcript_15449/m.38468 type:complete len:262 (-) Transcript_15449:1378-2163(-)
MCQMMRLPYVRVSSPPSSRKPAAVLNSLSSSPGDAVSEERMPGPAASSRLSRCEATLPRTCGFLCPAHAHSAAMLLFSVQLRHISHSARSASAARNVSRPALEISPAFLSSVGTTSSSSRSSARASAPNISWNSVSAFFTQKLRSWSTDGTAARINSCSDARTVSGWWRTRRRASFSASYCPCQSSSLRSALLDSTSLAMTARMVRSGSGTGARSVADTSSSGLMLLSQYPLLAAEPGGAPAAPTRTGVGGPLLADRAMAA